MEFAPLTAPEEYVLQQCKTITWDGDIASKDARDRLIKNGFLYRLHGWTGISAHGVNYLIAKKLLKS